MGFARFDNPMAASFTIGMNAHLAYAGIAHGRIVETLATREASQAGRMEGVLEIGSDDFLESSGSGDARSPSNACLSSLPALLHDFVASSARRPASVIQTRVVPSPL
jgi:hypothetical protein